ncbi:cilia and flagella-associated protein 47-like [Schistocerca nitens]|uniref:cilia and flagella-associated protein 47-like n=1 Tax=Schistocerca nitens TaxID=7011 RepID=UPI002117FBE2|nr:cilia and flagella-associated protein 47-like [Schistocerca nitens]
MYRNRSITDEHIYWKSELPEDNAERVHHLHRIYIHLVLFVSAQGGSIAHVHPKHLLSYDDYLVYMNSKINHLKNTKNEESKNFKILDAHKFKLRCTQSWLDIILQLQKVFILRKITVQTVDEVSRCFKFPAPSCGSMTHRTMDSDYYTNISEQDMKDSSEGGPVDPLTSNVYSTAEYTLLAWLGAHYSAQRQQLWTDSSSPPQRTVNNFSSDLQDSLVLSAVTASHCPYLIPLYLSKVLPNPTNLSQLYHNARCVCDAWEAVGLGFTVTAANIVNASPPFTVGLVAHLYEFLPGVYPQETIYFNTDLGGEITHEIVLQNLSKKRVTFFPRIIGDTANLFSIEYKPGPFHILASKKIKIPIKYNARKINRVQAEVPIANGPIKLRKNTHTHLYTMVQNFCSGNCWVTTNGMKFKNSVFCDYCFSEIHIFYILLFVLREKYRKPTWPTLYLLGFY